MVHMPWFIAYGPQVNVCDTKDFDENLREFILEDQFEGNSVFLLFGNISDHEHC